MNILLFLLVFVFVSGYEVYNYPLLNPGDVHLENLSDSSVVLTWKLKDAVKTVHWMVLYLVSIVNHLLSIDGGQNDVTLTVQENSTAFQYKPRLVVSITSSNKTSYYLTPTDDDKHCSIAISKCHLSPLEPSTTYKAIISLDNATPGHNVTSPAVLGTATVQFTTHAEKDPSILSKKILLYVVLPSVIGVVIIIVTLVIVCAKCCRCLCWRKSLDVTTETNARQHSLDVTGHQQEIRMSNHYDEAFESDTPMSRQESGRYLPVISGQPYPLPSNRLDTERHLPTTHGSSSTETRLHLDTIIAQQNQLQHRQPPRQPPQPHRQNYLHYSRPRPQRPPATGPRIDSDGYLDVIDHVESEQYANGLNML